MGLPVRERNPISSIGATRMKMVRSMHAFTALVFMAAGRFYVSCPTAAASHEHRKYLRLDLKNRAPHPHPPPHAAVHAAKWDCGKPCPALVAPVCTDAGITLQNECLAACQLGGLAIKRAGACENDTVAFRQPAAASSTGQPLWSKCQPRDRQIDSCL